MEFLLILFINFSSIHPLDEPPCWCEFEAKSPNNHYSAWVKRVEKDSLKEPWDAEWYIEVSQRYTDRLDSTLLWQSKYDYDGYPDGCLSDDGKYFTYVNYWFYKDVNIVKIYKEGHFVGGIEGHEFNIPKSKLTQTVSHELWLGEGKGHGCYKQIDGKQYLKLFTSDNKKHMVNCDTAELENW